VLLSWTAPGLASTIRSMRAWRARSAAVPASEDARAAAVGGAIVISNAMPAKANRADFRGVITAEVSG
jgi:hypothetical protein